MKLDTVRFRDKSTTVVPTKQLRSWSGFKSAISDYIQLPKTERALRIFRGHGDARWALETTLDRTRSFTSDQERTRCLDDLVKDFKRESMLISSNDINQYEGEELLLLARHHGLPTPLLDWSSSPYVAAYFAMAGISPTSKHAAIWVMNRDAFRDSDFDIEVVDDVELIGRNERALSQKGVFVKILNNGTRIEEDLHNYVMRWTISAKCREEALNDLDEMGINNRSLLMSLESAAKTASIRAGLA